MALVESHREEIQAAGLQMLAVGIGQPKHARRYCGQLAPSSTCIANESDQLHRAYGIVEAGVASLIPTLGVSFRPAMQGLRQGRSTGNVKMKHATFIIDSDGIIRAAHYARYIGDQPDISAMLAAYQASTNG